MSIKIMIYSFYAKNDYKKARPPQSKVALLCDAEILSLLVFVPALDLDIVDA